MLSSNLTNIKNELSKHHRDKSTLLFIYVQDRLNKSLRSYYSDLSKSAIYLKNRSPKNVINKM